MSTVAAGIVAFLLAGGFIAWIFHDMREATIHSQLGHLQVVRPGYFDKGIADPYRYLLPAKSKAERDIHALHGVLAMTPRLAFNGLIAHGETTIPFVGEGVDPEGEKPVSRRINVMAGQNLEGGANASAVILGEGLAKSLDVKPGDKVVLLATTASGSPNAIEVTVRGTFATIYKDYDDSALRLPIGQARKLMRVEGATSWVVLLDSDERTEDSAKAIASRLDGGDFEVVPWTQLADFYNKTVALYSKQVDVMKLIIGLIIILTISNTQTVTVLERTTEIGTSLAIGVRQGMVMRLFLIEGVLIGGLGGVAGIVLGYGLAMIISAIGIPMPPPPGMAHGYVAQIIITPALSRDALLLAFLTTIIASLMPAWKASRMNVVDALRCNQ
ncbi:MAG: ABC transporter permease [Betaproteobacteria bacterium]